MSADRDAEPEGQKQFNITAKTNKDRRGHWRSVDRIRERLTPKNAETIEKAISRQVSAAAKALAAGGDPLAAIDEDEIRDAYRDLWLSVYVDFAGRAFNSLEDATKDFTDAEVSAWTAEVNQFLGLAGAERIVLINDATKDMVRRLMQQAATEGWGADKAARELRKQWAGLSKVRAERIARTEIVGASNAGIQGGARATGLTLRKVWVATIDGRTREDHIIMDGAAVPDEQPFTLPDGSRLSYPGDPSGPAHQVIQCRCAHVYEVIE